MVLQHRLDMILHCTVHRKDRRLLHSSCAGSSQNTLLNTILTVHRGHEESQFIITISNTHIHVKTARYYRYTTKRHKRFEGDREWLQEQGKTLLTRLCRWRTTHFDT